MNMQQIMRAGRGLLLLPALALLAMIKPSPVTLTSAAPPLEVQALSFSIGRNNATTATGVHPADILGIGGVPLIPCENLGLACFDFATGLADDVIGFSFGADFTASDLPAWQFSVDAQARGKAGSAVRREVDCAPAQAQADTFESALDGANSQDLDGDGQPCSSNAGYGLSLTEVITAADNVDALNRSPCPTVDFNCDGKPEVPIYLTLAPDSPTLAMIGATPNDILMTGSDFVPVVWASGITALGLQTGDVIDGFCLGESGDETYGSDDLLLFSLAPGSPSLNVLSASAADLLRPSPLRRLIAAGALGLEPTDNLDALLCSQEFLLRDLYLPIITKQ